MLVISVVLAAAETQASGHGVKARRKPIACAAVGGLVAVAGSRTIEYEKDGAWLPAQSALSVRAGQRLSPPAWRAPARAGLKPERGAGSAVAAERSGAALDCVQPRYRAMLLLATFASLRFGELAALRRCDLDLYGCVVRVVRSMAQMNDGRLIEQEPKSRAGRRTVSFPQEIAGELRWHLECFAVPGAEGLVFVGPLGGRLRRSNFRDLWLVALEDAGLSDLHLHDLRHTGNTMAETGRACAS